MPKIQRIIVPDLQKPVSHYCHVTRAGPHVWVAGVVGQAHDGSIPSDVVAQFDIAILDVNLNGEPISPVVEVLIERGLPFVFATGYGQRGVPEPYRQTPTLQKPFQVEALALAIEAAAPAARN